MASYTMTIGEMMTHSLTNHIFPSNYDFYVDDGQLRKEFENKFIMYYYYREIGFESPFIFIQKLETHLLINMPYWKQLYETELEARNINFLLNKDLREIFIREIDSENQTLGTSTTQQNTNSTSSVSQSGTSSNNHKESTIRDGVSMSSLSDGYLTGVSSDDGTSNNTGESNSSDDINVNGISSESENERMIEKTELISQGNIGITSSAQLLKEWREVLINMDEIIIKSCNDLFMKIY